VQAKKENEPEDPDVTQNIRISTSRHPTTGLRWAHMYPVDLEMLRFCLVPLRDSVNGRFDWRVRGNSAYWQSFSVKHTIACGAWMHCTPPLFGWVIQPLHTGEPRGSLLILHGTSGLIRMVSNTTTTIILLSLNKSSCIIIQNE